MVASKNRYETAKFELNLAVFHRKFKKPPSPKFANLKDRTASNLAYFRLSF
nr:hypothetical protein [uncultured Campylobacter sp.]